MAKDQDEDGHFIPEPADLDAPESCHEFGAGQREVPTTRKRSKASNDEERKFFIMVVTKQFTTYDTEYDCESQCVLSLPSDTTRDL